MADQEYGDVVVTHIAPRVDAAPERALLSVAFLRDMHGMFMTGPDTLYVGHDAADQPVCYRITGWSAEHQSLIVDLIHEPVQWPGTYPAHGGDRG